MYCIKCGAYLDDSATFCPKCGTNVTPTATPPPVPPVPPTDQENPNQAGAAPQQPYQQQYQQPVYPQPRAPQVYPPSSNLIWGILTTIFCCLPLGIVSIVYAAKVDGLWAAGRFDEARASAKKAGTWAMWAAIAAVVGLILYFVFIFVFAGGLVGLGTLFQNMQQ
ncbi:MAG: CD225/dispanin family protein [Bacteroidales bacterium]|nr:CD225/dispanin family protein [Bacteroidales bacterium]